MPAIKQKELEIQFHKDMLNIYENARKIGYNASRFKQMVANQGGLNVAKKFIINNIPSDGFTNLWELGRLDLTVEALVLQEAYQSLFSEEERQVVLERLKEYGFEVKNDFQQHLSMDEQNNKVINKTGSKSFDYGLFEKELKNKKYIRNETETKYYIVIVKVSPLWNSPSILYKYLVYLLENNEVIKKVEVQSEKKKKILKEAKGEGVKLLHQLNPIVGIEDITMVHYKQDRPNANPWEKDKDNLADLLIKYKASFNKGQIGLETKKVITNLKVGVPAIRLLPMSESDPEFTGKFVEDLQEWFINELPFREYNFKKGMNVDSGTLVLFQYKGHVIASAILEEKIMFEEETEGGYRGAYKFNPSSIAIFTPITSEEMRDIWTEFKGFNQSLQDLDVKQYELLSQLFLNKDFRYVLDTDTDEETFQKEMEKSDANLSKVVADKAIELIKGTYITTPATKWKRNPIISKNAIVFAEYKCEYDNSHLFFISDTTGENYVEAHHLIPMEFQDQFENSLDVEANIISLCPLCHKTVHHAVFEEKEKILRQLYNKRKNRIRKCGIYVTEEVLLSYYE